MTETFLMHSSSIWKQLCFDKFQNYLVPQPKPLSLAGFGLTMEELTDILGYKMKSTATQIENK